MAKETANNGWICLHRAMRNWQWYDDAIIKSVFIDLLFSACTEPTWFKGRKLGRGQSAISVDTLAQNTGLSKPTVIKALRQLEESGEIVRTKWKFYVITTIRNYSKYQDFGQKVSKNDLPTSLPTSLPNKQYNNNNNNTTSSKKENTHTHDDVLQWLINSQYLEQFAMTEGISTDLCKKLANDAVTEWKMIGTTHRSVSDARKHLLSHIRKQVTAMREAGTLRATEDRAKRLQPLIEDCKALIAEGHKKEDVSQFYAFWTENCNDSTGRMRFEAERAWTTKTRFINFLKRKKQ